MAYLYEKSRVWRAIVHATKDRRILVAFTVVCTGAFGGMAYVSQSLTDYASASKEEEVRDLIRGDREATRYAEHSKRALEIVLANATGRPAPDHKHPMKMPQVAWHPAAVRRDTATVEAKEKTAAVQPEHDAKEKDEKGT